MNKAEVLGELRERIHNLTDINTEHKVKESKQRLVSNTNAKRKGKELFDASDEHAALRKIADLVNASDKSELSIRQRLAQKGFNEAAIDASVAKAKEYGFIDDLRYGEVLLRSRMAQGRGRVGIERELRLQNIDPYSIEGWDEYFECGDEGEFERALQVLERKPPKSKNLRESAFRKLVQKGYSTSVASSAARTWSSMHDSQ